MNCPFPNKECNKPNFQPYEKRLFSSVNGGEPITCPRWEATGEYIDKATFDPKTNTWKNSDDIIDSRVKLAKGSQFMNSENKTITLLNQDSELIINGRIKVKSGDSYLVCGNNIENSIEIESPVIDLNGFGIKSLGKYKILLNNYSIIKLSKGQKVFILGVGNKLIQTTLDEELECNFVSELLLEQKEDKKEKKTDKNDFLNDINNQINEVKNKINEKLKEINKEDKTHVLTAQPGKPILITAPKNERIVLTGDLLSKLSKL